MCCRVETTLPLRTFAIRRWSYVEEQVDDGDELYDVRQMVEHHVAYTGSPVGEYVLHHWTECVPRIIKVIRKRTNAFSNR